MIASSFCFTVFCPHDGQRLSILNFILFWFSLSTTLIIFGITSPDLSISTLSPNLISFLSISSWLCNVTLDTVTPETKTGLTLATGVSAPVLPTCIIISFMILVACWALNFPAIAHLGERLLSGFFGGWRKWRYLCYWSLGISSAHPRRTRAHGKSRDSEDCLGLTWVRRSRYLSALDCWNVFWDANL